MNIRVQVFVWSYVFILTDELKETRLRYLKDGKALVLVKLGLGWPPATERKEEHPQPQLLHCWATKEHSRDHQQSV